MNRASRALAVAVLACGTGLAGCVTERVTTNDGRPFPERPRAVTQAPPGLAPDRMMLVQGQSTQDGDGNGYPDRIHAMGAVFAPGRGVAIEADGAFVLTLWKQGEVNREGSEPIAEWRFEAHEVPQYETRTIVGISYQFILSILDHRDDRMPVVFADLRGRFEPSGGGEAVYTSNEVRAVRLGR